MHIEQQITEWTVQWGLIKQWSKTASGKNANYNPGSSTQSFKASYNSDFVRLNGQFNGD